MGKKKEVIAIGKVKNIIDNYVIIKTIDNKELLINSTVLETKGLSTGSPVYEDNMAQGIEFRNTYKRKWRINE